MMVLLYIMLVFTPVSQPEYNFKSTSGYFISTQTTPNDKDNNLYSSASFKPPGPKKVSGIDGWITWITWGQFNGVPSSASNEDMYGYYYYVQAGGTLSFNDWLNSQAVPIGEPICLLLIIATYILMKKVVINKEKPNI